MLRYLALLGCMVVVFCGTPVRADEPAPDEFSFGIGMGVDLPADLSEPNLAVASFRYGDIQLQPFIVFTKAELEAESDDGVISSKDDASEKRQGAGAVFKYSLSRRNKMDLQFIASLDYSRSTETSDPEGPNNRMSSEAKSLNLSYGLGLEWWFASNFSLMAAATNPVYSRISTETTQEQVFGIAAFEKLNEQSYGLVWDPSIVLAVMMWF